MKIVQKLQNTYSDKVVILIHIIVHLFRIGLRQAVGFVKGYMVQIGKKLKVISYTQASRRFKKLNLKIDDHRSNKDDLENVEIAVDSTRVSIYNNSGGHSNSKKKIQWLWSSKKITCCFKHK